MQQQESRADTGGSAGEAARIPELDGLRGISVIPIVAFHAVIICGAKQIFWSPLFTWGHASLDFFFVLSGYLITGILLRTRGRPGYWKNYLVRRSLRIFPAYYFCLFLIFVLGPLFSVAIRESGTPEEWVWYVFYLQNWKMSFAGFPEWPYVAHFWSLAVEEQFYLVWPLVVLVLGRRSLWWVSGALVILGMGAKLVVLMIGDPGQMAHTSTLTRMGAIAAGCWVACWRPDDLQRRLQGMGWLLPAVLSAYLLVVVAGWGGRNLAHAAAAIGLAVALPAMLIAHVHAGTLGALSRQLLRVSVLRFFGHYSYGIYLLHYPLAGWMHEFSGHQLLSAMTRWPNATAGIFMLSLFGLSTLAAMLMYRIIERPALGLKRRFQYPVEREAAG